MRIIALLFAILISTSASARWARMFGMNDMQYRVFVEAPNRMTVITRGSFLTRFPCYAMNSMEFFTTEPGQNIINIFCLTPPTEIVLGFIERPRGVFVARNTPYEGYMICPVNVMGMNAADVRPRLSVDLGTCERHTLNPSANHNLIRTGATFEGQSVAEAMEEVGNDNQNPVRPGR